MLGRQPAATQATANARGFGDGEHLLVWSWRRAAAGLITCPVIAREFQDACGEDGAEVFLTFLTFLKALGFASRRQLTTGAPGSLAVTPDERQVLALIAAAQAETPALFEAHLRWLSRPKQRHVLRIAAGALATALEVNGLRLVLPAPDAPSVCERPRAVA